MPSVLLASLPLQLVCQLLVPGAPGLNDTNVAVNQTPCQNKPPTLPEGYVEYPDIGTAYKVHNESVTWKDARKQCFLEGAQLALIDSITKFEYLVQITNSSQIHVGIHRFLDDWVSVSNGASVESIPWATGEPEGDYNCVEAIFSKGGLWNNACGSVMHAYVCEIPIP